MLHPRQQPLLQPLLVPPLALPPRALTQLAPNKQKLKHSMHGFLKDGHTADTYGFTDGEAIVVEAKTRGGR